MAESADQWIGARAKLQERRDEAEALVQVDRKSPQFLQWRLSVQVLLNERFGKEHNLSEAFSKLPFHKAMFAFTSSTPMPSEREHQEKYHSDLARACGILDTALELWTLLPDRPAQAAATPMVQVNNTASATSASSASASAMVDFPLAELLELLEASATPGDKAAIRDSLEDLDGELRKASPRWEKVKPALKTVLDAGKEIAVKTLAAVVAKMVAG